MIKINHENDTRNLRYESIGEGLNDININRPTNFEVPDIVETNDNIGLDFIVNDSKRNEIPESVDFQADFSDKSIKSFGMPESEHSEQQSEQSEILSHAQIQHEKALYLSKLSRLEKMGIFASKKLGMEHPLNVIKSEFIRLQKEKEINDGVTVCKTGLIFCVSLLEKLNSNYDPLNVDLDGWTQHMMSTKEDYNEVFTQLYEKYHTNISMGPEITLITMVATSAFMFSISKKKMDVGSIINSYMGQSEPEPKTQPNMRGPSIDTDTLLNKLNNDSDSDASSVISEPVPEIKTVNVPKKRGRKPKVKV